MDFSSVYQNYYNHIQEIGSVTGLIKDVAKICADYVIWIEGDKERFLLESLARQWNQAVKQIQQPVKEDVWRNESLLYQDLTCYRQSCRARCTCIDPVSLILRRDYHNWFYMQNLRNSFFST